jgi:hypothetical protein
MPVPEEFRCCVCLSVAKDALLLGCPHLLCKSCAEIGLLEVCPICGKDIPSDHPIDTEFAHVVKNKRLSCGCGKELPLLQAEQHTCHHTQKLLKIKGQEANAKNSKPVNRSTFPCPVCQEKNLSRQGLLDHCATCHASGKHSAVCPICASMPWGDQRRVHNDIVSHLQSWHKYDYDFLADYQASEQQSLERALQESRSSSAFASYDEEAVLARVLEESAREVVGSV